MSFFANLFGSAPKSEAPPAPQARAPKENGILKLIKNHQDKIDSYDLRIQLLSGKMEKAKGEADVFIKKNQKPRK